MLAFEIPFNFGADFSCSSMYSRSLFTRFAMPVLVLQLVPTFLAADQMTFLDDGCHTSRQALIAVSRGKILVRIRILNNIQAESSNRYFGE